MKKITLNIWGGHVRGPLADFFRSNQSVDIFCIQEVYHGAKHKISTDDNEVNLNVFSEVHNLLPEHQAFFNPMVGEYYGTAIFVHQNITVVSHGNVLIHDNPSYPGRGPTHSRRLQWVKCQQNNKTFYVLNVHGLWNGMGKTDTPERILQSEKIKNFLDTLDKPVLLCGDLNLRPDTISIKILEQKMNNLIKQYKIKSTRTNLYPKIEKYADYILISPEVSVNNFKVLNDIVSDHAPLLLDFFIY